MNKIKLSGIKSNNGIYATTSPSGYILKSIDYGENFSIFKTSAYGYINKLCELYNGDLVGVTNLGWFINLTKNYAINIKSESSYPELYDIVQLDTHVILIGCDDTAIFFSSDNGINWSEYSGIGGNKSITHIIPAYGDDFLFIGWGGLYNSLDNILQEGTFTCYCDTNDGFIYLGDDQGHIWRNTTSSVYDEWEDLGSKTPTSGYISDIKILNNNRIGYCYGGTTYYDFAYTDDFFDTYITIGSEPDCLNIVNIGNNVVLLGALLGANGANILKSIDNGSSWSQISGNPQQNEEQIISLLSINNININNKITLNNIQNTTYSTYYDTINQKMYHYVTIGTQQWMVENLDADKYNDGTKIPEIGNQSDWYLPSKDELAAIYDNLHLYDIGGFTEGKRYWSSSEASIPATIVYCIDFANGAIDSALKGTSTNMIVRAIRHFDAAIGTYSLRDRGPAGGWIFYIDEYDEENATYYEAAPYDQSTGTAWSNVTDVAVGTTGTAIGDGEGNTYDITHQEGHTSSAAKLCEDLTSDEIWAADTTGARCWYNNDETTYEEYGQLYNWYAVNTGKLAPAGWRVPTQTDFETLSTYLGGNSVAGGKLKEIGTTHWNSPNTGATDEVGFTALPGGYRDVNMGSIFISIGIEAYYLTASEELESVFYYLYYYTGEGLILSGIGPNYGFSIRCVRDNNDNNVRSKIKLNYKKEQKE